MAEQHGSFCVSGIHEYSQNNIKPSCTPRKLMGLTQQSAQPEPQNSVRTWCGDVNLRARSHGKGGAFAGRERKEMGRGRIQEKHTSPKAAGKKVENWNQQQRLN